MTIQELMVKLMDAAKLSEQGLKTKVTTEIENSYIYGNNAASLTLTDHGTQIVFIKIKED